MKRRDFIALLGGAAATWPIAARAQQRTPTVAVLGPAAEAAWAPWTAAFMTRARELGWIEKRTVTMEYRWADSQIDRISSIAAELVQRKVDVIVTGGAGVLEVKKATAEIPIVFALASDPLGAGLVASLARPGGNVTGLSLQSPDIASKRIALLREAMPGARRLALLANVEYPDVTLEIREVEAAAARLGFDFTANEIRRATDIEPAFERMRDRADALYVCGSDPLANSNRVRIATLALATRLPTMHGQRQYVEAGGLVSYGPSIPAMFRRAAELVDKVLHGTKPADIPVEQPTKFELIINVTTAKALGLTIPETFLLRADEVIE